MKEHYESLLALIERLPRLNSALSIHELSRIYSQYTSILDAVNGTSEAYKRDTQFYYSELSSIQSDMHQAQYAKSQKGKDRAFADAIQGLRSDMDALAMLIKRLDEV